MKRKVISCILCILLLTGCWDRRELIDLGITEAIALDEDPNTHEIIVTVEMVRPSEIKTEGGTSKKPPIELISTKGRTVFEAMRNLTKQIDRQPFYAHTKVLICSEEIAKQGLRKYLDVFTRSQELPNTAWLIIAKNTTAGQILSVENGLENIQAAYLQAIVRNKGRNSEVSSPTLQDFLIAESGTQTSPIAGAMEIQKEPDVGNLKEAGQMMESIRLTGTAVFKNDKLVGFLDDTDTKGLNWITGKMETGASVINSPKDKHKLISIEIKRSSTHIRPVVKNGKYTFIIDVNEKGNLVGLQSLDDISDPKVLHQIELVQAETAKLQIEKAIDKIQKTYRSDILGFGAALDRKYPKEWNKINSHWDTIFPNVSYKVNVTMKISNTELDKKPIEPESTIPLH